MSLHRNIGYIMEDPIFQTIERDIIVKDPEPVPVTEEDLSFRPMAPELMQEVATSIDTGQNQIYLDGYIMDQKTGEAIQSVFVQLLTISGGKLTTGSLIEGGHYAVWTIENPAYVVVKFSAKGYKDKLVKFSDLMNDTDVFLEKGSGGSYMAILLGVALLAIAKKKKRTVSGGPEPITIAILIGGGIVFFKAMGLFNDLLDTLGLGGDPTQGSQSDPNSPFKPTYWQQFTTFPNGAFNISQATEFAKTIHGAFTVFMDDYNQVLSVFSQMRSKANVSFLAWVFSREYNEDLLSFLTDGGGILPWDGLSTEHLKTIVTLVNRLPTN